MGETSILKTIDEKKFRWEASNGKRRLLEQCKAGREEAFIGGGEEAVTTLSHSKKKEKA